MSSTISPGSKKSSRVSPRRTASGRPRKRHDRFPRVANTTKNSANVSAARVRALPRVEARTATEGLATNGRNAWERACRATAMRKLQPSEYLANSIYRPGQERRDLASTRCQESEAAIPPPVKQIDLVFVGIVKQIE